MARKQFEVKKEKVDSLITAVKGLSPPERNTTSAQEIVKKYLPDFDAALKRGCTLKQIMEQFKAVECEISLVALGQYLAMARAEQGSANKSKTKSHPSSDKASSKSPKPSSRKASDDSDTEPNQGLSADNTKTRQPSGARQPKLDQTAAPQSETEAEKELQPIHDVNAVGVVQETDTPSVPDLVAPSVQEVDAQHSNSEPVQRNRGKAISQQDLPKEDRF